MTPDDDMETAGSEFMRDATLVERVGVKTADGRTMVITVVTDADDELRAAIVSAAASDSWANHDFRGEWGRYEDRLGSMARFTLTRAFGGYERKWLAGTAEPDFGPAFMRVIGAEHLVAILPSDSADVADMDASIKAALIVKVAY